MLAANYLFGVVTYMLMTQNKKLDLLGSLNHWRNVLIAAIPHGPPVPKEDYLEHINGAEDFKKIGRGIWGYLKNSAVCLVTGKGEGCEKRRAALFYLLGFWSARVMKEKVNLEELIERVGRGVLPRFSGLFVNRQFGLYNQ